MAKKNVMQEDLDNNPELVEKGIKVGDEIDIPEEETQTDDLQENDDTGGSNPPPNKERG